MISDSVYLQRAITLAKRGAGQAHPNPMVGCVIVRSNQIVAEGYHARVGGAHAESMAIAKLTKQDLRKKNLRIFLTLEPCVHYGRTAPCIDKLLQIATSIRSVTICHLDPDPRVSGKGVAMLKAAGIEVYSGEAKLAASVELNGGYLSRLLRKRPRITAKVALSLDGKIAPKGGKRYWISGEQSRKDAHKLRHDSDCIIIGANTLAADDPQLTIRYGYKGKRQPAAVVVSKRLKLSIAAKLWQTENRKFGMIFPVNKKLPVSLQKLIDSDLSWQVGCLANKQLDVADAMAKASGVAIQEVLLEGGSSVYGSFLASGLIDRLVCYIAPKILDQDAQDFLCLPKTISISNLQDNEFAIEHSKVLSDGCLRLTLSSLGYRKWIDEVQQDLMVK